MADYGNYESGCIHLHACRRFSKIVRETVRNVARGCNKDCSAYKSRDDFAGLYRVECPGEPSSMVRDLISDMQYGYSPDDLVVEYRVESFDSDSDYAFSNEEG